MATAVDHLSALPEELYYAEIARHLTPTDEEVLSMVSRTWSTRPWSVHASDVFMNDIEDAGHLHGSCRDGHHKAVLVHALYHHGDLDTVDTYGLLQSLAVLEPDGRLFDHFFMDSQYPWPVAWDRMFIQAMIHAHDHVLVYLCEHTVIKPGFSLGQAPFDARYNLSLYCDFLEAYYGQGEERDMVHWFIAAIRENRKSRLHCYLSQVLCPTSAYESPFMHFSFSDPGTTKQERLSPGAMSLILYVTRDVDNDAARYMRDNVLVLMDTEEEEEEEEAEEGISYASFDGGLGKTHIMMDLQQYDEQERRMFQLLGSFRMLSDTNSTQ